MSEISLVRNTDGVVVNAMVTGPRGTVKFFRRTAGNDAVWFQGNNGEGTIPGEWSTEHEEKIRAAAGFPRMPVEEQTLQQQWDSRLDLFERGSDISLSVPSYVREIARERAEQGGALRSALLDRKYPEAGWTVLGRELYGSLYDRAQPVPEPRPENEWATKALELARQTDGWQRLAGLALGDSWISSVATGELLRGLQETDFPVPRQDPQKLADDAEVLEEMAPDASITEKAIQEAAAALVDATQCAQKMTDAAMKQAVERAVEVVGGVAGGTGGLSSLVDASPQEIRDALARSEQLRRVAQIAGRLRPAAAAAQRTKSSYVPEAVVDVTVGGEISRLLSSELMLLALPETEAILGRKLLERQALQYRLEGREKLNRGPIVVAVDASGSMAGERFEWAAAFALALLEVALKQSRDFALFSFSGNCTGEVTSRSGKRLKLAELERFLREFENGGTKIGKALCKAGGIAESSFPDADIVLITDGVSEDQWVPTVERLWQNSVATYGVAIKARFAEDAKQALTEWVEIDDSFMSGEQTGPLEAVLAL